MFIAATLSAWSIFIALVGVSLNAIFTKPYTGVGQLGDEKKESLYKLRGKFGKIANVFIIIGTVGQLVSLIIS